MEEVFLSLGLDIIGLGVFNYDFKSITKESPVIKARSALPWRMLLQQADDGLCFASLRCWAPKHRRSHEHVCQRRPNTAPIHAWQGWHAIMA